MAKTVVGLEITEESVRAVEVTAGRAPALLAFGEVSLPPGAAKDSEILDASAVSLAIRQLWTRAGFKGHNVILGIGNRRILVREYTTQALRADLLRQALPFQVQDLLPVPANQAVLDFYPVSQSGDQLEGLLVAAVAETVEELIATLVKSKVTVDTVDLVPFGLARVARIVGAPGETVAMCHIGDHTTYVVIAVDGIPRFVRIIPIDVATSAVRARGQAPEEIDENVESSLVLETVPPQPVEDLPLRGRAAFRATNGVDPVVSDLVGRLRNTIAFYANRPDVSRATTVFLSGAGAAAPGVVPALTAALDATVRTVSTGDLLRTKKSGQVDDVDLDLNLVSTIGMTLGEGY
ncbi:MAG: pilus assembly protein PilM [Microbacterium sp.]|uniref:pilus assembly protein PilM n=1 Tax=Microbacterium sp. TaxID=51671 RepID=UPI001AC51CC4|nr:pilus assembly protein PilM [Microbacterium sp.]MBN9152446.1 pilus assembly protein PilM [Microbacterium sp.]MBN9173262.1 pilus assembly protein PilM [Microbacterium sp.]